MKTVVYVRCTPLNSNVGPLTLPLVERVNNLELCATRSEEAWVTITNKWMNVNDVEKSLT